MRTDIIIVSLLFISRCNILIAAGYRKLSKSHKTFDDYPLVSMEKSRPNNRVSGGYTAGEDEFPSFIGLLGSTGQFSELCNGVALSDRLILTVAHCFDPFDNYAEIKASPSIYHPYLAEQRGIKTYTVEKSCRSRLYDAASFQLPVHDYQILRLRTPIPGMNYSLLPTSGVELGGHAIAVGTGLISNTEEPAIVAESLQALPVQRVECRYDQPSHLCFQSYKPEHVGDTCQGDSGGPIYVRGDNGRQVVVGITSFGEKTCQQGHNGVSYNVNIYECLKEIQDLATQCS